MESFSATGHRGRALPCVLHGEGRRVALVLPGAARAGNRLGGTPARPDLHFTRALLQEQGYAVLEVWWDTDEADESELEQWLLGSARAGLGALAERGREPALLVGRSLGSVALALLRREEPPLARLPSIWVAPLMHREPVRESLLHPGGPCFVLCGGRDPAYDAGLATLLHRRQADVLVLERADHGLDCGDAVTSARALAGALEQLRDFLHRIEAS